MMLVERLRADWAERSNAVCLVRSRAKTWHDRAKEKNFRPNFRPTLGPDFLFFGIRSLPTQTHCA